MIKTITMTFEKETKNAVRYKEDGNQNVMGTAYVQKHALPEPFPQKIKITIEAA